MTLSRKSRRHCRPCKHIPASKNQAAQVLPIMAIFLGLSAGVLVAVSALGDRASRIAQADAVADAAALAAASGGEAEAIAVARANGYELLSLDWKTVSDGASNQPLLSQKPGSRPQSSANQTRSYCKVEARVRESARLASQSRPLFGSIFSRPLISSTASAATNRSCPGPAVLSETS